MNNNNTSVIAKIFIPVVSILLATFFHFLFSRYGFNPSDDGMFLSYSRRIIEGQIPHLDFISIRPALSAIIHLPEVYFFKENLLYFSRFIVLLQFSCICALWIKIFSRAYKVRFSLIGNFFLVSISFMLCLHSFPLMSWATIDAIFLISIGFYVFYYLNKKHVGYFILGCAYLCKQSFLFVPFAVILFFKDYRKASNVLAALFPLFLYLSSISYLGGLNDFFQQITAGSGIRLFLGVNITHFLTLNIWLGLIAMALYCSLTETNLQKYLQRSPAKKYLLLTFLSISMLAFTKYLIFGEFFKVAQFLFGSLLGLAFYNLYCEGLSRRSALILSVLFIGWSVSLSQGYPQTALFSGIFAILLIFYIQNKIKKYRETVFIGFILSVVIAFNFYFTRLDEIYRERPSNELIYLLEENLPGTKRILTNKNVFELFGDLKKITLKYKESLIIVTPDLPFYWATSSRINPLSADWLQNVEVPGDYLQQRIIKEIDHLLSSDHILIVQKFAVNNIANELESYKDSEGYSFTSSYIKGTFRVIDETEFFLVYKEK